MSNYYRGHRIELIGNEFVYGDTKELVSENYKDRACGYCGLHTTKQGHDGCIGELPGNIMNACCGHGAHKEAYIQYQDGNCVRGKRAINTMHKLIMELR